MRRLFSLHWTGYSIAATSGEVSGDNDNWGMYMGVYAGYGFTNLLAQAKTDPLVLINAQQQIDYAGTFASNETAKANLLRCGVKIAIDFGWPKQVKEAPVEEQLPTVDEEAERLAREAAERDRLAREAAEKEAKWNDFKNRIEGINVYFANGSSEPNIRFE